MEGRGTGSIHRTSSEPPVTIIVLTYDNVDDTAECLQSLEKLDYGNHSVLLVDNGSKSEVVKALRERFPHVEMIENGRNLGFAAGNNRGIERALASGAEYVFVLNNDAVVEPDCITIIVAAMETNKNIAASQPVITYDHDRDVIWSAGTRYLLGYPMLYMKGRKDDIDSSFEPPFGLVGCAMLLRASALDEVGLLDESTFLMHEETDWCMRARRKGYTFRVVNARVHHKVSRTQVLFSDMYLYYVCRNWLMVARKNLDTLGYVNVVLTELLVRFPYYIVILGSRWELRKIRFYMMGFLDGIKGAVGKMRQ